MRQVSPDCTRTTAPPPPEACHVGGSFPSTGLRVAPVDDRSGVSQFLSTLYLPWQANRGVTTLGLVANLEWLAALADPAEEPDSDERWRCATQALARFERYIRLSPTGCHLWTGPVTTEGYGQFFLNGRLRLARRVAYEL